jgi:hypothetical protein
MDLDLVMATVRAPGANEDGLRRDACARIYSEGKLGATAAA